MVLMLHGVHRIGHAAEHMFNFGAGARLFLVRSLLGIGEFMVPVAFFMNRISHATAFDSLFLSNIGRVCVQFLTAIVGTDKGFELL